MQPRKDLCPLRLMVFHVMNNGVSSSTVIAAAALWDDGGFTDTEDLDELTEVESGVLKEEEEGVEDDEADEPEAGLGTIKRSNPVRNRLVGGASGSSSSFSSSSSPSSSFPPGFASVY